MASNIFGLSDEQLKSLVSVFRDGLFAGKKVVISGGSSGIGKSIAWLFGRLGAHVVLLARNEQRLSAVVLELRAAGISADSLVVNIKAADQVREAISRISAQHGGFDVLVNSAGGQFPKPALDISDNGWRAVIDTNLNGTWYMMQSAAQFWKSDQRRGIIVNIVTVIDKGMVDMAHTCAARAGVIYLSKTVAVEWAQYGIRINCIAPGVISSEGMQVYDEKVRSKFPNSNPMKRFGSPWDIAQAVVYLASDAASFITGDVLTIDGGGRLWGELWTYEKPEYFES